MKLKLWHFIFSILVSPVTYPSDFVTAASTVCENVDPTKKRDRKCPGCHHPLDQHLFGPPSRHCTGSQDESPDNRGPEQQQSTVVAGKQVKARALGGISDQLIATSSSLDGLHNHLDSLRQEEEKLLAELQSEEEDLNNEIKTKEASIQRLRAQLKSNKTSTSVPTTTNANLPSFIDQRPNISSFTHAVSPLSGMLESHNAVRSDQNIVNNSLVDRFKQQHSRMSEIHLRPTNSSSEQDGGRKMSRRYSTDLHMQKFSMITYTVFCEFPELCFCYNFGTQKLSILKLYFSLFYKS